MKTLRLRPGFGVFLVALGLVWVFLATESGLFLLRQGIMKLGGGRVSIGQATGRLLGAWKMTEIKVSLAEMDVKVAALEWDWRPARLAGGELHVAGLTVRGLDLHFKDAGEKKPPSAGPLALPRVLMPLVLAVEDFSLERLRLFGSNGDRWLTINKIGGRFEGRGESLSITGFVLDAPGIGCTMHGNVGLGRRWDVDLLGSWWVEGYGFHPIGGTFSLYGPLNSPKVSFGVNTSGGIQVQGQVQNLLQSPEWTATVTAWNTDLSAQIDGCPRILVRDFLGRVAGDTHGYRGHATAEVDWGRQRDMHLDTDLTADWMGIAFDKLRIGSGEKFAVAEDSRISWRRIFDWQGKFHFVNFDPSVFSESLPGRITADFTNRGDVRQDYGVDVSFDIENLAGTLRGQKITAAGNLQLTEKDLRTDGLTLRSGEVEGVATIDRGMISWADQVVWDGSVRLKNFNPESLLPDFPGQINGEFSGQGHFNSGGPEGWVKIHGISGRLRGQELAGEGEIRLAGQNLYTKGLFLKSGASQLVVEGKTGDDFALDFTFSSPDIGKLLPDSAGAVNVKGSLRGHPGQPELEANLGATSLRYGKNGLGKVQAEIRAGLWPEGGLKGFVSGVNLDLTGISLNQGRIDCAGTMQAQEVSLSASSEAGELKVRGKGVRRDRWDGKITALALESKSYGSWRQQRDTDFVVAGDTLTLDQLCISDGSGDICAGGELQLAEALRWRLESKLNKVPTEWLNRLNLVKSPITGLIQADVAAEGARERILSGKAEVNLPETVISLAVKDEDFNAVELLGTRLAMRMADSRLLADFDTGMKNGSRVHAAIEIPGAGDVASKKGSLPLQGKLRLDNFDLAILSAVTGYGVEPTGRVNSAFVLGGTIGRPVLTGDSKIEGGGIALPYQGIMLENVTVSIEAGENSAKVACRATSGPGELKAEGMLRYGDSGLEGVLQLHGKNFLLVNLPEYAFRVTPDVRLRFGQNKGEISGVIKVPYGMITPEEMKDAVKASEDVILVNGRKESREVSWPFALDLAVQLGDDVRIKGHGLSGRLTGALQIKTARDELITGKGELDLVEGTFSLYSRTLNIERGRVLFTGGPIDNPGLDVRAQKKVTEEEAKGKASTVGVDISGLVHDLKYHLFSDPYMDDSEILSMMIVGHSMANSTQEDSNLIEAAAVTLGLKGSPGFMQGLGSILQLDDVHLEGSSAKQNVSLVVGKRLTKDLYIGYDINMFSQLGEFRVRYDLEHGFSIESRSSSQSTGADFLYSFER